MAFVAPTLTAVRPAPLAARSNFVTAPPATRVAAVARRRVAAGGAAVRMGAEPPKRKFGKVAEASAAKTAASDGGKFGWVPSAELLNGRAAMFGFLLGLTTEVLSGHSIYTQVRVLERVNEWLF